MSIATHRREFAEFLFLREIEFQAQLAGRAAERLPRRGDQYDFIDVWGAVQSILTATGNVSRILWPSREKYAKRGEMLRSLLEVGENSALADRDLRNAFEHYDERLEDWLTSSDSSGFVDQLVGPHTGFQRDFPQGVHRSFDPTTLKLMFRGQSIDLGAVLGALDELSRKCRAV